MKFLYSHFDEETGKSIAVLSDKYGKYSGQAKLHPDDKDNASKFAGCRIAYKRALINYLRNEYRKEKIMLRTIQNLNNDIQRNCKNIDPKVQRRINLKLRDYTQGTEGLKADIIELTQQIKTDIEIRDRLIQRSKLNKKND